MRKKFIFNPETLTFELKKITLKELAKVFFTHTFISLSLGVILGYILFTNFQTPEIKNLKNQNASVISNMHYLSEKIINQENRLAALEQQDDYTFRSVLGLNPIPKTTRILGTGGKVQNDELSLVNNSQFVISLVQQSSSIQNRIKLEAESYNIILQLVKERDRMATSVPSICPLAKKDIERLGSNFGYRLHPIFHVVMMHYGIDISAASGTPVYATGDGFVVRDEYNTSGYGLCVRIDHGYNYQTVYAHLSKILVSPGQIVKRGQLIGLVGSTGRSTSPHLHYEVRINNTPVNPINFFYNDLTDEEYSMIVNNASEGQSVEEL